MKARLEDTLAVQKDPRHLGHGDVFDNYGYSRDMAWNFYEKYMAGEESKANTGWVNDSDYEPKPLD